MTIRVHINALAACVGLMFWGGAAMAEDHPYTEGPVINVSAVRTADGRFDDYVKYLQTIWKAYQEAGKKAGYITGYKVITVEPRGENDPDIYLVVYFKNWAALDDSTAKGDAVTKIVEGSNAVANQGVSDRDKIRRLLGSWTGQQLDLK